MNILIVEDNEDNRKLAVKRLRASGHTTFEAADGASALERLQTHHPDVVLLDIQLPDMNGLEIVTRVRADPALSQTVLVACTAFAMASDRNRALEAGCDAYIPKPVNIRTLSSELVEIWNASKK